MTRKEQLLIRDGNKCHYCNEHFSYTGWKAPTIDHKVPKALGGNDHLVNLVLACGHCNAKKANIPYEVFTKKERAPETPRPLNKARWYNPFPM